MDRPPSVCRYFLPESCSLRVRPARTMFRGTRLAVWRCARRRGRIVLVRFCAPARGEPDGRAPGRKWHDRSCSLRQLGLPSPSGLTGTYTLRFTHAGTFRLYCLVHRGMSMVVRVVPRGPAIPSPAQAPATAQTQFEAAHDRRGACRTHPSRRDRGSEKGRRDRRVRPHLGRRRAPAADCASRSGT